jgi:carbon-monoxide dehydrogenase medium subunit
MKPARFEYHAAATLGEAVTLVSEHGPDGRVLAGGQSLIPLLNLRQVRPHHLIDVCRAAELDHIEDAGGAITIGAATRQARVEHAPHVRERLPLLVEALRFVASEPIRHMGTVVGSLAYADPAAEIPAVALAVDAELRVCGRAGERTVGAAEFFRGAHRTALEPGELLASARFPVMDTQAGSAFVEVARRHGAPAVAGAAVMVRLAAGAVDRVAIALCGVGATPVRARAAEAQLRGVPPSPQAIDAAADRAVADLDPPSDVHAGSAYRRDAARACVRRALTHALERAA